MTASTNPEKSSDGLGSGTGKAANSARASFRDSRQPLSESLDQSLRWSSGNKSPRVINDLSPLVPLSRIALGELPGKLRGLTDLLAQPCAYYTLRVLCKSGITPEKRFINSLNDIDVFRDS